jgi:type I restriction enzyme S subunit
MKTETTPLGEILDFFNGKAPPRDGDGEFIVYGSNGRIGYSKFFNHQNAIILGRVGAYCGSVELCYDKFWASDNTIVVKPKNAYDFTYLYYRLLSSPLRSYAGGAAQPLLTQTILRGVKIPIVRKIAKQVKVGKVLSAYDDMIENNRRRIQLLEQSARLLYKEWFVHLRFPGHEHVKINDGVPEGWEMKKIADICETVSGGTPSTKVAEYWDGDIIWVVPSDVTRNDCLTLLDSERKITEKGLRESSAKMVPPATILMTSRASLGFFALMDQAVCTNQGFINIIPHQDPQRMYLLFNLMSRANEIRGNAKGTTYPEISKGRFRGMDVVIPSKTLVNEFARVAGDFVQQVRYLKRSILQLAKSPRPPHPTPYERRNRGVK